MPRPSLTPAARAMKVEDAHSRLAAAIRAAATALSDPSTTADERMALWAVVEEHGATIHRQSRLLAGKSRGG